MGTAPINTFSTGVQINIGIGGAGGNGGNVTIIASGAPTTAATTIQTGAINTAGDLYGGTGGSITIATAAIKSNDGKTISFDSSGNISSGNTFQAGAVIGTANIVVGGDIVAATMGAPNSPVYSQNGANGGAVSITAGNNISTQNIYAFGAGGSGGGEISGAGNGGNGAAVTVLSTNGSINIAGTVDSSGGGGGGAQKATIAKVRQLQAAEEKQVPRRH